MTTTTFISLWLLSIHPCGGFVFPSKSSPSSRLFANIDGQALLDWMAHNDALSIGPSTYSGGGQGLFVTRDVAQGEVLLTIPESNVISVEDAWQDEELGDAFCFLTDEGGAGGKMASLMGFVAKEMLKKEESYWHPYLCMLPKQSSQSDHVLWWSNDEIEFLLAGSNVHGKVVALRSDTDCAIDILWQVLQTEDIELPPKVEWDDAVRAAYVSILSRAFEDDAVDCTKLLPVLDMTQHSSEANLEHSTNAQTGEVVVKARCDLIVGQELTIDYSQELEPFQFFPIYGFVPGEQTSSRDLLKTNSPVFFP